MPNADGTPDSIAEALAQPSGIAGGPVDVDQARHHGDHVGQVKHYEGLLPGKQRPYAWNCANCGTAYMGYIEDGCSSCGAGRGATQGKPEAPRDVICRACRGDKQVSVKCKRCQGAGDDPDENTLPCIDCGGAGTLVLECRRCRATGFDPEPRVVVVEQEETMAGERYQRADDADHQQPWPDLPATPGGMAAVVSTQPRGLPTIEDMPPPALQSRPRYLLTAIYNDGSATTVEIAESPKVKQLIELAKGR